MSYQPLGRRPNNLESCGDTGLYSSGSWLTTFTPQTFPAFLFTGGQEAGAPDPFVGFSFGVINTSGGNLTFNYSFTTPFAGGPYTMAQTIFVDSLINTAFAGTESVTPNGDPFIMESDVNSIQIPGFGRGPAARQPHHRFSTVRAAPLAELVQCRISLPRQAI